MTGPPPSMAVLHLDTGHVLAAAAVDGAPATVDSLTGGSHVTVRIAQDLLVTVPGAMLTVTTTDRDRDVLASPTSYRVVDAAPRVSFVGALTTLPNGVTGTLAREVVVIWQVGRGVEVTRVQPAADGSVTVTKPPMASHGIVAVPGQPLYSKT